MLERHGTRLEARLRQQTEPVCAAEQTFNVAVVLDAHGSVSRAQQVCVIDYIRTICKVGIPRPFDVPQGASLAVVAAMIRGGPEDFADEIGREERRPSRLAVHKRGVDRHPQIGFRGHVTNRIVDEDAVELTTKSRRTHVALDVLAFGVQRATHRQHARRWVNEHHLETRLQMRRVVTAAIFSVVYGVLFRPLPYPDSKRIMAVFEVTSKGRPSRVADPNFDDFRDQSRSFQAIAKYRGNVASVSGASQPTRTTVAVVSPDFLKVFGIQPGSISDRRWISRSRT